MELLYSEVLSDARTKSAMLIAPRTDSFAFSSRWEENKGVDAGSTVRKSKKKVIQKDDFFGERASKSSVGIG